MSEVTIPRRTSRVERSVALHLALLVLALSAAVFVWLRELDKSPVAKGDIEVWGGRGADVGKVELDAPKKKLLLTRARDERGSYFLVDVERSRPEASGKGADAAGGGEASTKRFVSVGAGDRLVGALAPLRALRALGRVEPERAASLGLDEPEGTLTIHAGKRVHTLVLGGTTPGGGDRYVRVEATGEVFVVTGSPFEDLLGSDTRLIERELHAFKAPDATRAKLTARGRSRQLVRAEVEGKRGWADASSKDRVDETLDNWLSNVSRLRPIEFREPPELELLIRVDYEGSAGPLGYVELLRSPSTAPAPRSPHTEGEDAAEDEPRFDYWVKTEHLRLTATVSASAARAVEQDLETVLPAR